MAFMLIFQHPAQITETSSQTALPIANAMSRMTKKPFGLYVSPGNSPVMPEKFKGYHTGVDFETLPEEKDLPVSISAICDGKILLKRSAQGYGGVLVQSCQIKNEAVTVVYGHLKLTSISEKVGDLLQSGKPFAVLGAGYSTETDGERKHLHLGIKKGTAIDLRGYVQNKSELSGWLDFTKVIQN